MDKEILFTGKRVDSLEWVEGYYCYYGWTGKQKHYIIPSYASALYGFEVDPETVGQYVGAVDMNGMKIFENDIVRYPAEDGERYKIIPLLTDMAVLPEHFDIDIPFGDAEIVGNKHDNPALMGKAR